MPLVCFLLVALLGGVALAVDLGRLNVSATEAQAAADAAALAGARALQMRPATATSGVPAAVNQFAAANEVAAAPGAVPASEIVATNYSEANKTSTAGAFPTASAVRVGVSAQSKYILGKAISSAGSSNVVRRSTAWIGNVNGLQCVLPIAVPYSDTYNNLLWNVSNQPNWNAPAYTQVDMRTLRDKSLEARTMILLPWGSTPPAGMPYDSYWIPLDFTGRASAGDVQNWATGMTDCAGSTASVGQTINAYQNAYQPSPPYSPDPNYYYQNIPAPNTPSSTYWAQIGTGLGSLCYFAQAAGDARCVLGPGSTQAAPVVRFVFTDDVPGPGVGRQGNVSSGGRGNGSGNATAKPPYPRQRVRVVALGRLLCYWRSSSDTCRDFIGYTQQIGQAPYYPAASGVGYPAGSMLMFVSPLRDIDLGSDVTLGDSISFTQRLVLVK